MLNPLAVGYYEDTNRPWVPKIVEPERGPEERTMPVFNDRVDLDRLGPAPDWVAISDYSPASDPAQQSAIRRQLAALVAEQANVDPPPGYVREYPINELHSPAQVLVDNGMVVRHPTGWEIFRHRDGGYGLAHDDTRDSITRYLEFTIGWYQFQCMVARSQTEMSG